jgi:hypothetical protein
MPAYVHSRSSVCKVENQKACYVTCPELRLVYRGIVVQLPAEATDFLYSKCVKTGFGAHPTSCSMGVGSSLPGGMWPGGETDYRRPLNAEVKLYVRFPICLHGMYRNMFTYLSSTPRRRVVKTVKVPHIPRHGLLGLTFYKYTVLIPASLALFHSLCCVLRQVHSLFQREFSRECDLVLLLLSSNIFSFP